MSTDLIVADQAELSIDEVKSQVQKIQQLMKELMQEGEHYGVVPGTVGWYTGPEARCACLEPATRLSLARCPLISVNGPCRRNP